MKITVLYVKHTGHVMAVLTRAAVAEAPSQMTQAQAQSAEVRALTGEALVVRDFLDAGTGFIQPAEFLIPAEQLAALTTEPDEDILLSPRNYVRDPEDKLLPLSAVPLIPALTLNSARDVITVTLPAPVLTDTAVSLHIQPVAPTPGEPQVVQGTIQRVTGTEDQLALNLRALPAGTHNVLTLVAGSRSIFRSVV